CKAFVWVLRSGVGTCLLKSSRGIPYAYTGASASYVVEATPAPTPSACPVVENDVDYAGNDILYTSRANYQDCCTDCQNTVGCSLYVWGSDNGGACYLKSKKGSSSPSPGARAGVLPLTIPGTPLSNVKSGLYAVNSLPPTAFNYITGAQWIDQGTLSVVNSETESFVAVALATNFSHGSGPIVVNNVEMALSMTVYINVTSAGECADMTATYNNNFFTYWASHLYCIVHLHTAATSLQMLTATGQAITFPQDSDPAYLSTALTNVATNTDCVLACTSKGNCAGVEYSTSAKTCALYQPQPATFPDVTAGWVMDPVSNVDVAGVQYTKMTTAALPNAYIKESVPGVASLQACASSAKAKAYVLFGFNSNTKVCAFYAPTPSPTKGISLVNTPLVPVVLSSGTFGSDVASGAMAATTAADCYKLCVPSQNLCFATVFDSTSKACTYVQPSFDAASTMGWIIPKTLPDAMATVSQVDVYVTAHEDDHELFMSAPVYNSIKSPTTKSVFVYLSAGDAGETSGWWQAREVGTVAATKTWVNMFGVFSPVPVTSTVLLNGHHIQKISIGNTAHYFLRLSENNLDLVLNSNVKRAPIDQPTEYYANAQAVKDVLKGIIVAEATKVPKVNAHYSDYLLDPSGDHVLHVASGRITAELLNADAVFAACVSQFPYFGYQRWLDTVNMNNPEQSAQRAVWLGLGAGILNRYPRETWSDHSPALGRTYTGTLLVKATACAF
ncbi:hypothetical protein DYB36_001628, partial [Aphanomyces astaci]